MFGIDWVNNSLLEKVIQKNVHQLVWQPIFSAHEYRTFNFESQVTNRLNLEKNTEINN